MTDQHWYSDVKGVLHFDKEDEIKDGVKAKWTLEWVMFYRDEWKTTNFKACVRIFPHACEPALKSRRMIIMMY